MKLKFLKNEERYERKWELFDFNMNSIFIKIYRSNFFFKEIYKKRLVNSIYYDDNNLNSIIQNLDGLNEKVKYRIRWYGDSDKIINPVFEVKSKVGFITHKKIYQIKNLKNLNFDYDGIINISSFLREYFKKKNIFPITSTHYERYYFLSSNKLIRGTLDTEIQCKNLKFHYDNKIKKKFRRKIFEIKYHKNLDDYVKKNFNNFLPRISKSSKYVLSTLGQSNLFNF